MDKVLAAAARQGFWVRQTRTGTWVFGKGFATLILGHTPRNPREWTSMLNALRAFGLKFPERRNGN